MDISTVLNVNHIKLNLRARTKGDAIEELTDLLCQSGSVSDKEMFLHDVWQREKEGPTAFENLIALPHSLSSAVKHTTVAIGRTRENISWPTPDDCDVRCIILYAISLNDKESTPVQLLKQVSIALADDDTVARLLTENKPEEIIALFNRYSESDNAS